MLCADYTWNRKELGNASMQEHSLNHWCKVTLTVLISGSTNHYAVSLRGMINAVVERILIEYRTNKGGEST